ncbi:MAG: polysaccharide biosynthesis/export family protein [Candidatus Schekmanbacteria bacterium]|nr:polysaccharide biosynthesis/export family protein [Candidatus Schekmanbacteria bacterium]
MSLVRIEKAIRKIFAVFTEKICGNPCFYPAFGLKTGFFILSFSLCMGGCAGTQKASLSANPQNVPEEIGEVKIREFVLSPGDEINITVFQHDELSRKVKIPPDGIVYYPAAGKINVTGKSLEQLREIIVQALSEHNDQRLLPGDEISITVSQQEKFNREFVIPPDGYIFYPMAGEIKAEGKSCKELRQVIVTELSKYKKYYLMPGDEISITVYDNEKLNRKLIIPPEGIIFYPLVGEIEIQGKNLKQVREAISAGLLKHIVNPQVEVNLVSSELPKIIVDPQVAVDIKKATNLKRIADPQVSIEVVNFSGQKIFVLGEVSSPGVYLADGHTDVLEAISQAGGMTLNAREDSILLVRGGMNNPSRELITFNIDEAFEENTPLSDIPLKRGDIVFVPRTFIADVDRFFTHLSTIISPLLTLESAIYIGQQMEGGKTSGKVAVPTK